MPAVQVSVPAAQVRVPAVGWVQVERVRVLAEMVPEQAAKAQEA